MNPLAIVQLKSSWDRFQKNHPKFPLFLRAVSQNAIAEGTVIEMNVTTAEGRTFSSNLKLTASDIELIRQLQELSQGQQP